VAANDLSAEDVMPYYTAIVTMLAVAFYFFLATRVAAAHIKFDVRLPATTGNSDFERIYRVHINTLEWMPIFFGATVALCNLLQRRCRSSAWTRLDRGPHRVLRRVPQGRGEAVARLLHPGDGVFVAFHRRCCRPRNAPRVCLRSTDSGGRCRFGGQS
jgi:MAPEG family